MAAKASSSATASASSGPSVAAHPRAALQVARAKGWGGLVGFLLGGYLSLPTNTLVDAGIRALVAGAVCYVVTWAAALFVWRRLVVIEIKRREQELLVAALAAPPEEAAPVEPPTVRRPVEPVRAPAVS
jgi:predicted lipid-binding transport protein (Tim44 family)